MAKNIQDLRREAGYRSAKDFAAAVGIAGSTYTRYESQPDAIPLKQAWAIADFLGCSIDMVVGREPVDVEDMRGDVQRFYDNLSADNRDLMDDYMDYIKHREKKAAKRKAKKAKRGYQSLLHYYKTLFDSRHENEAPFGIVICYRSPEEHRAAFKDFLTEVAEAKLKADIIQETQGMADELRDSDTVDEEPFRPLTEEEIQQHVDTARASLYIEYSSQSKEVIDGIMEAYDEQSGRERREWLTYLSD